DEFDKLTQSSAAEIELLKENIKIAEQNFETLKGHAEKKIQEANEEINKVRAQKDKEVSLMRVQISKAESKIKTLEASIETKTKENADLMGICDDLIAKMGG
ncbi:hypothetical protein IWQ62_006789, partial [Dispira parvispora]